MMPNSSEITDIRDSSVAIKQSIDNSSFEPPEYENLEVVFEPEKHLLWLNMKPQRRPSYTMELLNDFLAAFHWIKQVYYRQTANGETPIRYVVTASKYPGIYNLGGDLPLFVELIRANDRAALRRYAHLCIEDQYLRTISFGLPIINISLVQGDALGGGFECALTDDIIIAERSAKLGTPEVLFNLFPGMGALSLLSRRLDAARAGEFILKGCIYPADELYEMGLVDVLAEDGTGREALDKFVHKQTHSFNSHQAIYRARRLVNPVSKAELLAIADLWVDTALNLGKRDLRKMERLAAAQNRKWLSNSNGAGNYILPNTEQEAQRLRDQAGVFEEPTNTILDRVGLSEGMRCLDVGCGAGDVMRLMGQRVGKTGKVTGIDANALLGSEITTALNKTGISSFEFVGGKLEEVTSIAPGTFDLSFARFLLLHLPDPIAGLKKMWEWTKPGGCLVVMDFDFRTMDAHPQLEAIDELNRIIEGVLEKVGLDPKLGHKIPHHFEAAGIGIPDGIEVAAKIDQVNDVTHVIRATYESFLPMALKLGIVNEENAQAFSSSLNGVLASNSVYFQRPLVVGAWKRKVGK